MKRAFLAATALIATSFTPIGPTSLFNAAAELPSPNVLLCTDTKSLGPSQNGHFWGTPLLLLPVNSTVEFDGPFSSGDTEYFVATVTTTEPLFQRCLVINRSGHRTGKYQDIEVAPAGAIISVFNCQPEPTDAGIELGYVNCDAPGGSPDDR
jgi:hypothetical protein